MKDTTVKEILNKSKTDFTLEDFYYLFEENEELEELLNFIDEYDFEIREFLRFVLPEVMNRLKIRMIFASAGEDKQ